MNQKIVVDELMSKKRIDKLVAELYPQFPRTALRKLLDSGHIKLNGLQAKAGLKVRLNDEVTVDTSPLDFEVEAIDIPLIYEDDNVLVVNKPSGVISHARGRFFDEASVASFLRDHIYGRGKVVKNDVLSLRAGIVHRLDRATSGVMICAKNEDAMKYLQRQFADRTVQKTYIAAVEGEMPSNKGLIDMPIQRNPLKPQTFRAHPEGKESKTKYEVTRQDSGKCLLKLTPLTGRTHQLRVHLAEMGHPIIGDDLYGGYEYSRLLLHAASLEINIPGDKVMKFEAPLPGEFTDIFNDK